MLLVSAVFFLVACNNSSISLERGSEEVSIKRDDINLSGTLELPTSNKAVPAVLMVQGSGAFDRSNLGLFDTLANRLAMAGYASLRFDDRGTGKSGGIKHNLSANELGEDIAAWLDFLFARPEINHDQIGLLGHSFGGALVPVVSSRSGGVAFVITLSGYAVTGEQLMMEAREFNEEARGTDENEISRILAFQQAMFTVAKSGGSWEEVEREHRALRRVEFNRMDEANRSQYDDFDSYVTSTTDEAVLHLAKTPWFKSFLTLNPAPAIDELNIPFLAIFGSEDTSTPPDLNVGPMREALSDNPNGTVQIIPGANHFMNISSEPPEELFSTTINWLSEQFNE